MSYINFKYYDTLQNKKKLKCTLIIEFLNNMAKMACHSRDQANLEQGDCLII